MGSDDTRDAEQDRPDGPSRPDAGDRRVRATLLRLAACVGVAAVLGLPLALSWAVTHTVVE